jgi:hypothetical protein
MTLEQCQTPPISKIGKTGEISLFDPVVSPTMPKRYKMKLPTINSYVYQNNISTGYTGHPIGSIAMTLEQCQNPPISRNGKTGETIVYLTLLFHHNHAQKV